MEIFYGRVVEIATELLSISGVQDLAQLLAGQISVADVGHRYLLAGDGPWASVSGHESKPPGGNSSARLEHGNDHFYPIE